MMKNLVQYFVCSCIITTFWACTNKEKEGTLMTSPDLVHSDSYKTPKFIKDARKEKIMEHVLEVDDLIREHMEERNIPGIAYGVVVDNELVTASGLGYFDLENQLETTTKTAFRMASLTKSFTAMAILKLRDEGKLSLHDPVSLYVPEMAKLRYPTTDSPVINIENLMTMTSGFPEDNAWGDRQLDESEEMLSNLIQEGMLFSNPPSSIFEYSNTSYAILGQIISRVSDTPYQDYITNNILKPLGMYDTYWEYSRVPQGQLALGYRWEDGKWTQEPLLHDGAFGAIGGLITTVEDFAKYVGFHLAAWPPRNEVDNGPIKRSTVREMHIPQFPRLNAHGKDFNGEPCASISGYGYGLGISTDCHAIKQVSHGGALPGYGCSYFFYPEYGIGVMAFGNLTYTDPFPYNEMKKLLFGTIGLEKRQLPISDILKERKEQLVNFIQGLGSELEDEIFAENFYLDFSRDYRMAKIEDALKKAGEIQSVSELEPINHLRGRFNLQGSKGLVEVFFSLTPEKQAKIQQLDITFRSNQP